MFSRWTHIDESLMHSNGSVDLAFSARGSASLPPASRCARPQRLDDQVLTGRFAPLCWLCFCKDILRKTHRWSAAQAQEQIGCFSFLIWVNGSSITAVIRRQAGTHPGRVTSPSLDTHRLLTQEQFKAAAVCKFMDWRRGEHARTKN